MSRKSGNRFSGKDMRKQNTLEHTRLTAMLTADDIIRLLDLEPHPEGGHYRQTFRDSQQIGNGRAVSTAIYFLLARGERSHWHRVDAVEIWHWHAGAPLKLEISEQSKRTARIVLGR